MNIVILQGRLATDPVVKHLESGKVVCNFNLAVNNLHRSEKQGKADFFSIQCWGKLAEITLSNLTKGRLIVLEGYMKNNNWVDENNKKHRDVLIVTNKIEYLDYPKKPGVIPPNMSEVEGELPF